MKKSNLHLIKANVIFFIICALVIHPVIHADHDILENISSEDIQNKKILKTKPTIWQNHKIIGGSTAAFTIVLATFILILRQHSQPLSPLQGDKLHDDSQSKKSDPAPVGSSLPLPEIPEIPILTEEQLAELAKLTELVPNPTNQLIDKKDTAQPLKAEKLSKDDYDDNLKITNSSLASDIPIQSKGTELSAQPPAATVITAAKQSSSAAPSSIEEVFTLPPPPTDLSHLPPPPPEDT